MKMRTGFVSNSSSSSFLVAYDDFSVFDGLKGVNGYEDFRLDAMEPEADEDLREFFRGKLGREASGYEFGIEFHRQMMQYHQELVHEEAPSPQLFIERTRCHIKKWMRGDLGKCPKEAQQIVEDVASLTRRRVESSDKNERKSLYMQIQDKCQVFSEIMLNTVKPLWKYVHLVRYADDDGAIGDYMEHEFMERVKSYSNQRRKTCCVSTLCEH